MQGDLFFPKKSEIDKILEAQMRCLECMFREECNQRRKDLGITEGIWAGNYVEEVS